MTTNHTGSVAGPQDGETAGDIVAGLYRAHGIALIRMALLLTGDQATAEDVVQDAFLGFHRAMPGLRDKDKALSISKGTVSSTISRALAALSRDLREEL